MSQIAPTMQRFFTYRLVHQREASPATVASYRDSLRLLIGFIADRAGKAPSALDFDDIDDTAITAFLTHLETDRHNTARTRNNRLAAIRALFRYAALWHPEHAEQIARVLAIPQKNHDKAIVTFLTHDETQVLLGAPDPGRWEGRRDRAMLALTVQTGIRLSELTGLNCADIHLATPARISPASARAASTVPCRSPRTPSPCYAPGPENETDSPMIRCSRPAPAAASATTPSNAESPSTSTPPNGAAPRSPSRTSRPTCCATPRRWHCSKPASTSPSSPCGSATKTSAPHRPTSTPTSPSRNEHSPPPRPTRPNPGDSNPTIRSSPSSKPCNYADPTHHDPQPQPATRSPGRHNPLVGMSRLMPMSA